MMQQQNQPQDILLRRLTQPDGEGYFQYSVYQKIADSSFIQEESKHYKVVHSKIRVPKARAAEVQQRILDQIEDDRKALHKEDIFLHDTYFMPMEQKTSYLRNTQRSCVICGGPHSSGQCPLKKQQQMMFERPKSLQMQESTFSVRLEPLPQIWERGDVFEFVKEAGNQLREKQSRVKDAFLDMAKRLKECTDEQEKLGLQHEYKQMQKLLDEGTKALDAFIPKRVAIIQDKNYPQVRFAFIHFGNEEAARSFAQIKSKTLLTFEQTYMNASYQGEFKKK